MPTHNHKLCESIDKMPTTNIVVGIPDLYGGTSNIGAVAQWIRRLTSDQETVGSSPTGVTLFIKYVILVVVNYTLYVFFIFDRPASLYNQLSSVGIHRIDASAL